MLRYALEDDYDVRQACNGQEALNVAAAEQPAVIVMDLDMPIMDGVEATRRLKADPDLSAIKVLAVSGQHDSEKARLVRDEADAFIEKPFAIGELLAAVKQLTLAQPVKHAINHGAFVGKFADKFADKFG